MTFKAKAKAEDLPTKAKATAKDLPHETKARAKDFYFVLEDTSRPRPRTNNSGYICLVAPWVQMSVIATNALQYHKPMPISCHFQDCKPLLFTSLLM